MSGLQVIIPSKLASNLSACLSAICGGYERYRPGQMVEGTVEASRIPPTPGAIVVDDDLGGAVKAVAGHYAARRVEGEKPFIFARNCNLGIKAAGEDDVILCNDDALLRTPGGFAAMQQAAAEHPEYGIISATTNLAGNLDQQPHGIGLRDAGCKSVAFVCVLILRNTIDLVGMLDERFTAYGWEDNDYCRRVRNASLKVGIFDGCFVDHASLKSTFRGDPRAGGDIQAGSEIYRAKWGSLD